MKVLVTGGAGFIGSYLTDELVKEHEVIVADNLVTGKRECINKDAKFYKIDVTIPELCKVFRREKPEIVFHLVAQINVRKSIGDPLFDLNTNVGGTVNLLGNCIKFDAKKIIYASSGGAVYGEPDSLHVKEDHPTRPLGPYGLSKLAGEKYIKLYGKLYDLDYTILRYSNVYGPRQDPEGRTGVINIFIHQLLKDKRPTIFGNGKQTRDFIYVDDIVEANLVSITKGKNNIFNVGLGCEKKINEIFKKLWKRISYLEPIYEKSKRGEVRRICSDITKAEEKLDWKPKIELDEGMERTMAFFKDKSDR